MRDYHNVLTKPQDDCFDESFQVGRVCSLPMEDCTRALNRFSLATRQIIRPGIVTFEVDKSRVEVGNGSRSIDESMTAYRHERMSQMANDSHFGGSTI